MPAVACGRPVGGGASHRDEPKKRVRSSSAATGRVLRMLYARRCVQPCKRCIRRIRSCMDNSKTCIVREILLGRARLFCEKRRIYEGILPEKKEVS